MARPRPTRVFVFGAGKVGSALARGWSETGLTVVLRAARRGVPRRRISADVVVLAVRDADVASAARDFAHVGIHSSRSGRPTVLHCAGGLEPAVLAPCREAGMAVAQLHPLLSFVTPGGARGASVRASFRGATAMVRGDSSAVADAEELAKRLGLIPRRLAGLPAASYHGAAAWVANGSAALCEAGVSLLHASGVGRATAAKMLGPLLRSVADNVEHFGLPRALSGPVRRGDARAVQVHLAAVAADLPEMLPLYVEVARTQLAMARELGEASPASLKAIERALSAAGRRLPRAGRGT